MVAAQLRACRQRACLSREALADALGASLQQVQNFEDGSLRPSASMLVRAAKVFDVPVRLFFHNLARLEGVCGPGGPSRPADPRD